MKVAVLDGIVNFVYILTEVKGTKTPRTPVESEVPEAEITINCKFNTANILSK